MTGQQSSAPVLTFTARYNGSAVTVQATLTYPVYDISLNGRPAAQLQQDHHGNWFLASGYLDDSLVQETGERIVRELMGG